MRNDRKVPHNHCSVSEGRHLYLKEEEEEEEEEGADMYSFWGVNPWCQKVYVFKVQRKGFEICTDIGGPKYIECLIPI